MKTDKQILDEYCADWDLNEEGKKAMSETFGFKNHILWVRIYDLRDEIVNKFENFLNRLSKKEQ